VGRELRRRGGHRHAGERPGLSGAVQVYRKAQQADADYRPAEAFARGYQEARGGAAKQQGERVAAGDEGGVEGAQPLEPGFSPNPQLSSLHPSIPASAFGVAGRSGRFG